MRGERGSKKGVNNSREAVSIAGKLGGEVGTNEGHDSILVISKTLGYPPVSLRIVLTSIPKCRLVQDVCMMNMRNMLSGQV